MERQRITIDLDQLFPGEIITIGNSKITIRPLDLRQIAEVTKDIKDIIAELDEQGVTFEQYSTKEGMFKIAVVLINKFPEVLAEVSNVASEDLFQLPLSSLVEILQKVVSVNMKSKDDLLGNFNSLIKALDLPTGENQTPQKIQE